jgi:FkbM family methyltransferase
MNKTLKRIIAKLPLRNVTHQLRCRYLTKTVIEDQKGHEADVQFVKEIVRPGDYVIDIGANIGLYTKHLSLLTGPSGKVISIEPLSQNVAVLECVIKKLNLKNVEILHGAVASTPGRGEVYVPETGTFEGFYLARFAKEGDKGERQLVEVFTLDQLLKQGKLDRVDFIKCDVEGAELEVLKGATTLLLHSNPSWLVEISREISEEVFSFMQSRGYYAFVYSGKILPTTHFQDGQFSNYFFFHPASKYWGKLCQDG